MFTQSTRSLRIIVSDSADEAARIVERLERGENFVAIAKSESIDPSAEVGGLLGRVELSSLRPELADALRGLSAGQLSRVVRIPTGFAVLKVVPDEESEAGGSAGVNAALAARGDVKYVLDVAGFGEATSAFAALAKGPGGEQDLRGVCTARRQALVQARQALEGDLAPDNPNLAQAQPFDLMQGHFALGQLYAYAGEMDRAIARFEQADHSANAGVPAARLQMMEALGIAYLHKSEMDNGVYRRPGSHDLLSPAGVEAFQKTGDSAKAVDYFLKYLAEQPDSLEVKWLLNLAYMTLGGYPARVPKPFLIPPASFASAEDVGRFVDVAPQAGLDSFASAGGLIVDDFDNDGRLDLVTSTIDSCEPMHFFHRNADGSFTERAAEAGLGDQLGGLNIVQADYDNDGCLDILVLRGGWELPQRKSLLHNNCNGTFSDVTEKSGLSKPTSTQTAVWTDINNDGLLDLFVGNENGPAQLFLNEGHGAFEDIAHRAGVDRTAFTKGVTAADYDNDGWPDLYVSNLGGDNFLYHNNHDGTFTEMAKAAGVVGPWQGFATWFFDYDNDGWQDLFVTSYFTSVDESARTYLNLPHKANTLKLYRNLGDGSFQDVTRQVGLDKVYMPMGANFGDIDNDGFLDIYLGTGNPSYASLVPSVLLRNRGGKSFVDVTSSSGTGELHKGHGVAFADLDNDGNEDIVFEVGGATIGDAHAIRLFHNPGHANDWINLKLVGVTSNRAAIGARISATLETPDSGTRVIHRIVTSGGSFGASPLQQHVGLGAGARIASVDVWWPTSGTRQHFTAVGKNQTLEIRELAQDYTRLERPPLPLTGGKPKAEAKSSRYEMKGLVLRVDAARTSFLVSHDAIPGVMGSMTMTFPVRNPTDLAGVEAGMVVEFALVVAATDGYAEQLRIRPYESVEQDPLTARRLKLFKDREGAVPSSPRMVAAGQPVPDFTLTDQRGRPVTLSSLRGKVVAVNFIYTSCALPQFCFRTANHFGVRKRRFKETMNRDLVLLTVTFDPVRDQPERLADYARQWNADPASWHFLTGTVPDVRAVCELFGVDYFPDEGLMEHSLHTVVIDRQGRLAANVEGNQFTSAQLGDLVSEALAH